MKSNDIYKVLDLARSIRKTGKNFNPLFCGAPGIAKSSIIQDWCRKNNLPFIDIRAAYLDGPEIKGYPFILEKDGKRYQSFASPDFLPTEGEGVLLLEEPNRGTTMVLNTFMQILTDRVIDKYKLPEGWIIVAAMNPETAEYDVTNMDPALKNRFVIYNVEYDKNGFLNFMQERKFDDSIRMFVESNTWTYLLPEKVSKDGKYVSPRTLEALDSVLKNGLHKDIERPTYEALLGTHYGKLFYDFKYGEQPILYSDLTQDLSRAIAVLKSHSNPENYKNGHISVTIRSLIENHVGLDFNILCSVLAVIPSDQGVALLKELEFISKDLTLTDKVFQNKELSKKFKDSLTRK